MSQNNRPEKKRRKIEDEAPASFFEAQEEYPLGALPKPEAVPLESSSCYKYAQESTAATQEEYPLGALPKPEQTPNKKDGEEEDITNIIKQIDPILLFDKICDNDVPQSNANKMDGFHKRDGLDEIFESMTDFYICFADFRLQLSDDKKKDTGQKLVKMFAVCYDYHTNGRRPPGVPLS